MFVHENIKDKIHYFAFDNQYEACASFMRMQEYYESPDPKIRGQWFNWWKFMDSYARRHGNFTYTTDWHGFNIPGDVLRKWYRQHHSYSDLEFSVLKYLQSDIFSTSKKFYVIASSPDKGTPVIDHELCHALYYLDPVFKADACDFVNRLSQRNIDKIFEILVEEGYTTEVLVDELVAYLTTSSKYYIKDEFGLNNKNLWIIRDKLKTLFHDSCKEFGCDYLLGKK